MEQLQSHIWLTASSYMGNYFCISSYFRKPFLIYDFATAPLWISLYIYEENFILFFISAIGSPGHHTFGTQGHKNHNKTHICFSSLQITSWNVYCSTLALYPSNASVLAISLTAGGPIGPALLWMQNALKVLKARHSKKWGIPHAAY